MKQIVTIFIMLFGATFLNAQLGVGEWRMHVSPYSTHNLIQAKGAIYVALEKGILEYEVSTGERTLWTAADFLSDVSPSALSFHQETGTIIIGYENGNVDLVRNNRVSNFPYILQSSTTGRKRINEIVVYGDFAYLATGVGIVVIDLKKREVRDTYHARGGETEYIDIAFKDEKIYVITDEGLYEGNVQNLFLADPGQWTRVEDVVDYTAYGKYTDIETYGDKLLLVFNNETFGNSDTLYQVVNGTPIIFDSEKEIQKVNGTGNELLVSAYDALYVYDADLQDLDLVYQYEDGKSPRPMNAIRYEGMYYIADKDNGLVRAVNSYARSYVHFEGPRYNSAYRAEWLDDKLAIACGGYLGTGPSYTQDGGTIFENENWTNIDIRTEDLLKDENVWDFVCTSVSPKDNKKVAFGTLSHIPIVITNDGVVTETFTPQNSLLEKAGDTDWTYIGDVSYDEDGHLWVANSLADRPLKVLTNSGEWYDFEVPTNAKGHTAKRLIVDNNGVKWLGFRNGGILAYNHGSSIENAADDKYKVFNTGANTGDLPSNEIEAIAADFDNNIWIGTPEGMRVLYNSSNVFDAGLGEYNFQKLLIEYGENVEIVLGTTHITSIKIDGANRKWIATGNSGVFLLSSDGLEVLKVFTKENSPLLSNTVYDLAINHTTGEVFFLTEDGIISYRSDASQGDIEYEEVKVFPNPVYPEMQGPITIQGIAYDSDVKITDVSGKLIYKTKSNGGTATWNGKTMTGERVKTGVYLIWTSIDDYEFKGRYVGKVLVIE